VKFEANDSDAEALPGDAALMARICWFYFKEGQTQEGIAQRLGLTRKRVNRFRSPGARRQPRHHLGGHDQCGRAKRPAAAKPA